MSKPYLIGVLLFPLAYAAQAIAAPATQPAAPYAASVSVSQVTQFSEPGHKRSTHVLVRALVVETPADPAKPVTVLTHPSVMLDQGQHATMWVSGVAVPHDAANPPSKALPSATTQKSGADADSWSGVRLDVYCPTKQAQVNAVITVWDEGLIVWADAQTLKVGEHSQIDPAIISRLKNSPKP
jgi:hypothetical protein